MNVRHEWIECLQRQQLILRSGLLQGLKISSSLTKWLAGVTWNDGFIPGWVHIHKQPFKLFCVIKSHGNGESLVASTNLPSVMTSITCQKLERQKPKLWIKFETKNFKGEIYTFFSDVPVSKSIQFVKFNILECWLIPLKSNFNVDFSLHNQYYSKILEAEIWWIICRFWIFKLIDLYILDCSLDFRSSKS